MTKIKGTLQPVAFTLRADSDFSPLALNHLEFPSAWRQPIQSLQGELYDRVGQPNTVPIASLNGTLRALVPHLLTAPQRVSLVDGDNGRSGERPAWLLAREQVPATTLMLIVMAWLEKTFSGCDGYATAQRGIRVDDLCWESKLLPLTAPAADNGTAKPEGLAYIALPVALAELLVVRGATIDVHGEPRAFVRVPARDGAEVMSWPPTYYADPQGLQWPYSYIVRLSAQTIVGDPCVRVHAHYGVRRWRRSPLLEDGRLALRGHSTSVYVRVDDPPLGLSPTGACTVARLEARHTESGRVPAWADLIPQIAERLMVNFPDAGELARDPSRWLAGVGGVQAAVIEPQTRHHPIKQGVSQDEHERLTGAIAATLAREIALVPPLRRLPPLRKPAAHVLQRELRDMPTEERLDGLERSVGRDITVEVAWQTPRVRDMLVDRVLAVLMRDRPSLVGSVTGAAREGARSRTVTALVYDSEEGDAAAGNGEYPLARDGGAGTLPRRRPAGRRVPEPEPTVAPEAQDVPLPGGGRLRIITRALGELGAPLPEAPRRMPILQQQTDRRAREVATAVPRPDGPTVTLVELPNYQDPRKPEMRRQFGRWRDPKIAIRLGLARAGRVSQFVTGEADGLRERCDRAVRDALRHLGYLPAPIGIRYPPGQGLPPALTVAAVWFIRLTRKRAFSGIHFPVVVLMHTQRCEIKAWLPDGKGIRPYRQALIDVSTIHPDEVTRRKRWDAIRELQQFLTRDLPSRDGDLAILAVAQNARETWSGLNNPAVVYDHLRFDANRPGEPVAGRDDRIRVVRLRTSERGETPEWYEPSGKAGESCQGLWLLPETRTYYNVGSKPHTMSGVRRGKGSNPTEHYALPSILEVLPLAIHAQDQAVTWVATIDQWRRMSYLTNDMILLPLPLDLAEKIAQYAEVIGPWAIPDEWAEGEDEDEEDFATDVAMNAGEAR